MCGIAGYFGFKASENIARAMGAAIASRGPDDSGVWIDENIGLSLAHRRLAIIDLTAAGRQPMTSKNERFVIVFNGEIYNHLELRSELKEIGYRGHSDTETLIEAIAAWGVETALKKCVGMFAFALYDREAKTLTLARDRFGEKPLYYGFSGGAFLFGSELKALKKHPAFAAEINRDALALYLRHNYIPAPHSIYKGIKKLRPAHYLTTQINRAIGDTEIPEETPYWSYKDAFAEPLLDISLTEAADELERLLRRSIRSQMIADVPLGAFLSGGIDSSAVAAIMQVESARPARTFSIGFNEADHNEAHFAKAVAAYIGAEHTELYVTPSDALAVVEKLPELYDEPFGDSSQIPTYLVSQMTRGFVTVALSGDGGDELFYGYHRYFLAEEIWRKVGFLPPFARRAIARGLKPLGRFGRLGDRLAKASQALEFRYPEELYARLISLWQTPDRAVLDSNEPLTIATDPDLWLKGRDFASSMQFIDALCYLADDILTKVDRAAMGVSLETRAPFLDHRIAEFAARLPRSLKSDRRGVRETFRLNTQNDGGGKRVLREVLYRFVPRELIDRPKMGFGVPIERWLRKDLREMADDLLSESRLKNEGFFDHEPIVKMWREHKAGDRAWHYALWHILIFELWLKENKAS